MLRKNAGGATIRTLGVESPRDERVCGRWGSLLIPTTGTFSKASDQATAAGAARLESLWKIVLKTSA